MTDGIDVNDVNDVVHVDLHDVVDVLPEDMERDATADVKESTRVLQRARALVDKGWCKGVSATNAEHIGVHPLDDEAVCWCAGGAIDRAAVDLNAILATSYLARERLEASIDRHSPDIREIRENAGYDPCDLIMTVIAFNDRDGTTKEEVLRMFDLAIEEKVA